MPPRPRSKTTESSPLTNTGVDYVGLLHVKNGGNQKKVWMFLFTCSAVRAVHLEVVEDMKAEHFLEAFCRFIARRGKPNKIISDNATLLKLQGIQSMLLGMTSPATVKYTAILAKITLNGNSL